MKNRNVWLTIVGIEESGLAGLRPEARQAIESAEYIFGGARHIAMTDTINAKKFHWQSPFSASVKAIRKLRGSKVVVLATGDPQWFGVGNVLCRRFSQDELAIIPGRSAFSLAASKLGWSLARAQTLTLHGREFENLARYIMPQAQLLVLTANAETPALIADHLGKCGFGDSNIHVFEHLGGSLERVRNSVARNFDLANVADLNIVAVECSTTTSNWNSLVPGLPDTEYEHDGQLTKSVVRAATLVALKPFPGALLWDVGAGSGSIGIEWMRAAANSQAFAIEMRSDRVTAIRQNAANLGVPGLEIVEGRAPETLEGLNKPDAIFIGGGLTGNGVFDACWKALPSGGILVANGVTLESEAKMIGLHGKLGGELQRISVESVEPMGGFRGWQQAKPVIQWRIEKPGVSS